MPHRIAVSANDRTRPIMSGRVPLAGWEFVDGPIEELFSRAFQDAPYELTEISFSNYLISVAAGTARYIGLPVFTSRSFRHSAIYVRTGSGITEPAELAGRRVGLREYTNTAALVVRGMLRDEYGVRPETIDWFAGDVDEPVRDHVAVPDLGPAMSVTPVVGRDLSQLLLDGELDAIVAYHPPRCFGSGAERLFPDYPALEADYHRRTGHFPIMHLLAARTDFAEANPAALVGVAAAFAEAKRVAWAELLDQQALKVMLPWLAAEAHRTVELLGQDYWSYGLGPNREALRTQIRYSREQSLIDRDVDLAELFLTDPALEAAARG